MSSNLSGPQAAKELASAVAGNVRRVWNPCHHDRTYLTAIEYEQV
jgi:hypothetical protein